MNQLAHVSTAGQKVEFTVSDAIARALQRHGVTQIFGQSIPAALFMATPKFGIAQIGYRTENAGGAMADGYARISGKVGVVAAQNGPAATLLVPPLAEALKASVPVVALVQDVALSTVDKNAFQEFDHIELFKSCTKWARRLDRADRVDDYIDMAFAAAVSGRPGPVALMLPMDLLRAPAPEGTTRLQSIGSYPLDRYAPEPTKIARAAERLVAAKQPVIISGGGVHLSQAQAELARLSDLLGCPVGTTNMGKATFDETSDLFIGMVGNSMEKGSIGFHTKEIITKADLIVLVGNRTNQNGTDNWSLFPKAAHFIHIDIDPVEIGRNYEAERLVGDARATLAALADHITAILPVDFDRDRKDIKRTIASARARFNDEKEAIGPGRQGAIRPEWVMSVLNQRLSSGDIVVADASYSTNWSTIYLEARHPNMRFMAPRGLAGLGWGVPMAMGAKLARPDANVFAIAGDGGFGHCWQELETARRMNIRATAIILNNGILGFQAHAEHVHYGDHTDACEFLDVDHAAIARACGCFGERVTDPSEVEAALNRASQSGTFAVVEIMTEAAAWPPISLFSGKEPWNDESRHNGGAHV
ncbi:Acetolactate synthase large subunit IlvB1 [Ensifer adhaerens]|nr:Acetolactate synthase large subunit IlvB1 [Ensifer adhaerens]